MVVWRVGSGVVLHIRRRREIDRIGKGGGVLGN